MSNGLRKWIAGLAVGAALAGMGACLVVDRAVNEHYSPGWHSETTENAMHRKVFVGSPAVVPAMLRLGGAVELRVVDAWIERPTHVEYRWLVRRTEVQDSGYRLVVHLAQVPRDTTVWTYASGRCFVWGDFHVDGQRPAVSGNGDVRILVVRADRPFADTVRLSVRTRGSPQDDSGDPPSCGGI